MVIKMVEKQRETDLYFVNHRKATASETGELAFFFVESQNITLWGSSVLNLTRNLMKGWGVIAWFCLVTFASNNIGTTFALAISFATILVE